jgi:hypothetical protein
MLYFKHLSCLKIHTEKNQNFEITKDEIKFYAEKRTITVFFNVTATLQVDLPQSQL